jgi:voltage-gated potassium channel
VRCGEGSNRTACVLVRSGSASQCPPAVSAFCAVEQPAGPDRVRVRPGPTRPFLAARSNLRYLIPGAAILVLLAGGGFAALETDTVESYWEGVWWALSLMTTVGFANGTPHTAVGKGLSSVIMVLGFALLALTTAAIASLFVREEAEPEELREHAFEENALAELRQLNARLELIESRIRHRD